MTATKTGGNPIRVAAGFERGSSVALIACPGQIVDRDAGAEANGGSVLAYPAVYFALRLLFRDPEIADRAGCDILLQRVNG